MTVCAVKGILFCTIFGVLMYAVFSQQEYGNAKVGDRCERDRHCIKNAFCRSQYSCTCDPYHSPTADKSMCLATAGLGCVNDTTCATMTNGLCRQGICACKEKFILDIKNSSNCIPIPIRVGDLCQRSDECRDAFEHSFCINDKCTCFTGHHFVEETKKCIVSRGLYNACQMDNECHLNDKRPDALHCKNNECVCKEGEPGCNKGSHHAIGGLSMILLLLLHSLI